jgi:hypothetical protein
MQNSSKIKLCPIEIVHFKTAETLWGRFTHTSVVEGDNFETSASCGFSEETVETLRNTSSACKDYSPANYLARIPAA